MFKAAILLMLALPMAAQAESTRDPFKPSDLTVSQPETVKADFSHWRVDGFMFNQKDNRILVNGQPLRVGDSIEGWQIVQLDTDEMTMTVRRHDRSESHTLSLRHLHTYR